MIATRMERLIPDATGIIAVIIMVCAFMLSFSNLQAGAIQAGISPLISWMWPICVDALLIAGSLMILRSSLRQESTGFGWAVVIMFTGISVVFNIVHSPQDLTSRAAHAIPPITLMVSIEMFTMIIRSDLARYQDRPENLVQAPVATPGQPEHDLVNPCSGPDHHLATWPQDSGHEDQLSRKKTHVVTDEAIIELFLEQPDIPVNQASAILGMPRSSLRRRVTKLEESGHLARTGIPGYPDEGVTG